MSKTFDPVPWLAAFVLAAGAGVTLWWAAQDDSGAPGPAAAPASGAAGAPVAGGSVAKPIGGGASGGGSASEVGWVPGTARDAIARDQADQSLPDGTACEDRPNPVDIAKDAAAQVEGELRKATAVSDAEEAALGERLEREAPKAAPFAGKWDLPQDRERFGPYLQGVVDHLAQHGQRSAIRYRVHVVRDEAFNAFALPGGVLAVHTAVLQGPHAVQSEAELAAVLGHEIAHVERRHPVAAYQYAKLIAGDAAEDAAVIVHMLKMPISTEYEHEADARGLELAAAGQYDPFAACKLWLRHGAETQRQGQGGRPSLGGIVGQVVGMAEQVLHSHPPTYQRCARTRELAKRLNAAAKVERWYRGEQNIRELVPGPKKTF